LPTVVLHEGTSALIVDDPSPGHTQIRNLTFVGAAAAVHVVSTACETGRGLSVLDNHLVHGPGGDASAAIVGEPCEQVVVRGNTCQAGKALARLATLGCTNPPAQQLVIEQNTVFGALAAVIELELAGGVDLDSRIALNAIQGAAQRGIQVRFLPLGAQQAVVLAIESNNVRDTTFAAVELDTRADLPAPGVPVQIDVTLHDNVLRGANPTGLLVDTLVTAAVSLSLGVHCDENLIKGNMGSALESRLFCFAPGAEVDFALELLENRIELNGGRGIECTLVCDSDAGAVVDARFESRHDVILDNYRSGIEIGVIDQGPGDVAFTGLLRCDRIKGNGQIGGGQGVLAAFTTTAAAPEPSAFALDLGRPEEYGHNILTDNDPAPGTGLQLVLVQGDQPFSGLTIPAYGNWWGSVLPGAIEGLVHHQIDDPGLARVEFGAPLADPLPLVATPMQVPFKGGELVTVGFGPPGGAFCASLREDLVVTLGGLPVHAVTLAPDGQSLTFLSPVFPKTGPVELYVANPAGQTGVLPMSANIGPPVATTYCNGKLTSCGSVPFITWEGFPSPSLQSGFVLRANKTRHGKPGLLMYTDQGPANKVFQGGTLCLQSPLRRTPPIYDSGGTQACSGVLEIDMNAFAAGLLGGSPAAFLSVPGTEIHAQFWGRDLPGKSLLTNGVRYQVGD
jgi:hypothetical protein